MNHTPFTQLPKTVIKRRPLSSSRLVRPNPPAADAGQSLIEYAVILIFVVAVIAFILALIGPAVGDVFSRVVAEVDTELPTDIVVTVQDEAGVGVENTWVYAFDGNGRFLSLYGRTDAAGEYIFTDMDHGDYQFLGLYRQRGRYQYVWSRIIGFPQTDRVTLSTATHTVRVQVLDAAGAGIANAYVYAFTANQRFYAGQADVTGRDGTVTLTLPPGDYVFRAYLVGQMFWSETVSLPQQETAVVETGQRPFTLTVLNESGSPARNVRVYLFNGAGAYLGVHGRTNQLGEITFQLPANSYKFRADYRGRAFYSETVNTESQTTHRMTVERR